MYGVRVSDKDSRSGDAVRKDFQGTVGQDLPGSHMIGVGWGRRRRKRPVDRERYIRIIDWKEKKPFFLQFCSQKYLNVFFVYRPISSFVSMTFITLSAGWILWLTVALASLGMTFSL